MLKAMSVSAVQPDQEQIEGAIRLTVEAFPDQIAGIRYSIGEDWTEEPALFVRVLLHDPSGLYGKFRASGDKKILLSIGELLRQISTRLSSHLKLEGYQPYFTFRTLAEQQKLRDPDWQIDGQ